MELLYIEVKEARSIRGCADLYGCIRGKFFALEVKRDKAGANSKSGRTVLQRHKMNKIREAGGFACFIYPEVEDGVLTELILFSHMRN